MRILTLLTDFGAADHYVAAVKGVVLSRLAEAIQVVDITHAIAPGDIEGGALVLAGAAASFPPDRTVHLAVVDPGVGSDRRLLAVRSSRGVFLAPDNGLLDRVIGPAAEVRSIERPDLWQPAAGATFHGRDRLAPVAAFLLAGGSFAELGPEVDDPERLDRDPPRQESATGGWGATVVWVDHFGNLITDLPASSLPKGEIEARVGDRLVSQRVGCYAELDENVPGILVGSLGTVELALREKSLARAWGVTRGARVHFCSRAPAAASRSARVGLESMHDPDPLDPVMAARKEPPMATTWEYHIINVRSEGYRLDPNAVKELNRLGAEGWELVSVTSVNFKTGATDNIAMVFKRPLADE